MPSLRIAVVGCGYWGPNLVRTFVELPDTSVEVVADLDPQRCDYLRGRFPQIERVTDDYRHIFDLDLDAVVVSTPPDTHYGIVRDCLEQGLDVLVEKPLAIDSALAGHLVDLAKARDRILMVGHIGAYIPAVRKLKSMIESGELGDLAYIDAVRAGLGLFRASINVIWDLAPHSISILMYLLGDTPRIISARGVTSIAESIEDVAYLSLGFSSGLQAHVRLSWLDPCKTRRLSVVGKQKMVVYDDLEAHEKLKVYDRRVDAVRRTDTFGDYQFAYHYGSVVSPYIHHEEPLRLECQHFAACVRDRVRPLTDGENGLQVVEIIEAAQRSLRLGGVEMPTRSVAAPLVGRESALLTDLAEAERDELAGLASGREPEAGSELVSSEHNGPASPASLPHPPVSTWER